MKNYEPSEINDIEKQGSFLENILREIGSMNYKLDDFNNLMTIEEQFSMIYGTSFKQDTYNINDRLDLLISNLGTCNINNYQIDELKRKYKIFQNNRNEFINFINIVESGEVKFIQDLKQLVYFGNQITIHKETISQNIVVEFIKEIEDVFTTYYPVYFQVPIHDPVKSHERAELIIELYEYNELASKILGNDLPYID